MKKNIVVLAMVLLLFCQPVWAFEEEFEMFPEMESIETLKQDGTENVKNFKFLQESVKKETSISESNENNIPFTAQSWNEHFYQVYEIPMDWNEAKIYCENMGGHLLTINGQDEQNFINSLNFERTDYWIGGTDEDCEGRWKWITDEAWQYENWHDNQPDNDKDIENYLVLVTSWNNEWNDAPLEGANDDRGFICEWDYGKQIDEIKYLLKPEQVWGFKQNTITDNKLNLAYYMRFYNLAHASILLWVDNGLDGYCNGMATSVNALAVYGNTKTKSFLLTDGKTSTCLSQVISSQLKNSTTLLKAVDYVKYAHIYQYKFSVMKEYKENKNQLNKLYQAVKASIENGGEPVEISIRGDWHKVNKKGEVVPIYNVGHSLLVTGISYDTPEKVEVLVYDGNFSTEFQKLYLYKENGNIISWKYQVDGFLDWGTGKSNNMITYTTQGNEVSAVLPKSLIEDIKDKNKYLISVKNRDAMVETTSGSYSLEDSTDNMVFPIYTSNETKSLDKNIYWIDTTDKISIKGSKSSNDIQIASNNRKVSVNIPKNASVSVDLNKSKLKTDINTLSSDEKFSAILAQYDENSNCVSVILSGTADAESVFIQKENKNEIRVSGVNEVEVQFQNEDESKTEKIKVDLEGKLSQIKEESNGTIVKQDSDDDGTYDKIVYDSSKTNIKDSSSKLQEKLSIHSLLKVIWKKIQMLMKIICELPKKSPLNKF